MDKSLIAEIEKEDIDVITLPLSGCLKGLYADNIIAINQRIPTTTERTCVLAEEFGRYYTAAGNILDQSRVENANKNLEPGVGQ